MPETNEYLYEIKDCFLSENEMNYLGAIIKCLPAGYCIQPQVGLRSILNRTDNSPYQNELHRYVDACIFDSRYHPVAVIEINDSSHYDPKRKERDKKVQNICEEAGLPIVTLWTSYGINEEYITKRLIKAIEDSKNPVRIKHSASQTEPIIPTIPIQPDEYNMTEPQINGTQTKQQKYSSKHRKIAILLSVFFGFIGVPFYYIGKPLFGLISTIPFALYGLIQAPEVISLLELSNKAATIYSEYLMYFCVFVNFILVLIFSLSSIKDKYGLPLK